MEVFFSVGEPSGDEHAAHLIQHVRSQRSDVRCVGFGGPEMEEAGCRIDYPLTNLAVMGFLRVIPMLWTFITVLRQASAYFRESKPDAVVLVDFPGFNWWVARKAKAAGIPVIYYLPPQMWAWAPWRVKRLKRLTDHVLCGLPFEEAWYAERGVEVEYVGHPFFDEVHEHALDAKFVQGRREDAARYVAVLPGSRNHEIEMNWPVQLEVIRTLSARHSDVRFLVANYKETQRDKCRAWLGAGDAELPIEFVVGKTSEIIEASSCCLMVSGSVSLELLARGTPSVVVYRGSRMLRLFGNIMVICKYITLANLIAGREIMPEFPFAGPMEATVEQMTGILDEWLSDPEAYERVRAEMQDLRDAVAQTGATRRAAEAILSRLGEATEERRAA
ncbi:MAG: lipid-A-disaccharide synthase [Planctomycetaceae bacterium]|nr:lipid-A-disaccharide synthase [Planctomycetaceae bacterium]